MPPDLLFGVSSLYLQNDADSDGFSINTDRYIVVTDPTGFRHQDMYALWVRSHYFRTEGNFFQTKIFPLAVYLSCAHIIGFTELLLSNLMTTA